MLYSLTMQLPDSPIRLMSASSRFNRAVARRVETTAAAGTWRALAALDELGPTRVSDLADWQRVSQPTMTTLVRRMEAEGLVERAPDPEDGRASLVSITDEGRHQFGAFRSQALEVTGPAWARLSAADRSTLARAAELLAALLEEPELQ